MDRRDFQIHIHAGDAPDRYRVSVRSPAGEGREVLELPAPLAAAGEPSGAGGAAGPSRHVAPVDSPGGDDAGPRVPPPEALGTALFEALVRGDVRRLYDGSSGSGDPLRIRLELDLDEPGMDRVAGLPWELLFDPRQREYLALGRRTPLVRLLHAPRPQPPAELPSPLRILGVLARPRGLDPLDLDRERRAIEAAWEGISGVELELIAGAELGALRHRLLEGPWHVLHFMGHGGFDGARGEGVIYLEDGAGGGRPVAPRQLAERLRDTGLRLIVLNACDTARAGTGAERPAFAGVASALVRGGAPAVVAMQRPISDAAALVFSATLYRRLAAGDPVEQAVTEARLAVAEGSRPGDGFPEWAVPVLFLRAPDGRVFEPVAGAPEGVGAPRRPWWRRGGRWGGIAGLVALLGLGLGWSADLLTWWDALAPAAGPGEASPGGPCGQGMSDRLASLSDRALLLADRGRLAEARSSLAAVLEEAPDLAVAHANLGSVEDLAGRPGEALEHYREAARLLPECALHQYNLGAFARTLGHHETALGALARAVELEPGYVEAHNELGNLYLDLARPGDARRSLETALSLDPDRPALHKNLARVALLEDRPAEAAEHLETALDLYPGEDSRGIDEATYLLARAHAAMGEAGEVCRRLGRFRSRPGIAVTEWERLAAELGRSQDCEGGEPPATTG